MPTVELAEALAFVSKYWGLGSGLFAAYFGYVMGLSKSISDIRSKHSFIEGQLKQVLTRLDDRCAMLAAENRKMRREIDGLKGLIISSLQQGD